MSDILKDAAHWKERADDARRLANEMTDEKARNNMLDIAESYERLAVRAQLRTKKD
jgi:hypothetical protein